MNQNTQKLIEKFYEIENCRGTNAKKDILRKYANDETFKQTLGWYFNNLIVTGLREKKIKNILKKKGGLDEDEMNDIKTWNLIDLLNYLNENNTGSDHDAFVVAYYAGLFDEKTREGIIKIATKSW